MINILGYVKIIIVILMTITFIVTIKNINTNTNTIKDAHCDENIISNESKCNDIICRMEKTTQVKFNNEKDKFLFLLVPELINFLKYIKSNTNDNTHICFLSRDCYFLAQLYKKMYPHDTNYEYVFCSRAAMYTASQNYMNYITNILKKRKNTLWIDIQGSGDSHVYFFKKYYNFVPPKLFFKKNSLQKKFVGGSKLNFNVKDEDYNNLYTFKGLDWKVSIENKDFTYGAFYLESLCRAPHKSIIDVNDKWMPIYENKFEAFDKNLELLINTYDKILKTMWVHDKINYRTEYYLKKNTDNKKWNGLVAFDIDNTITKDDNNLLISVIRYCLNNNLKIIFITARPDPFEDHKNGTIRYLMEYLLRNFNFDYVIDIWFNPLSIGENQNFVARSKISQLGIVRKELNLPIEKCMIIDDDKVTIDVAKSAGYTKSVVVSNNGNIGLNSNAFNNIKMLIN